MSRWLILLALLTSSLFVPRLIAQTNSSTTSSSHVSAWGLHLVPISDKLFEQNKSSKLKRGDGVAVDKVTPNSPAALAGLKQHDLLVSYDGTSIRDVAQFVKLIDARKPDRAVPLVLWRAGKEITLQVNLHQRAVHDVADLLKGQIKPGGPPEVIVEALPLDGRKMKITFTYYPEGKSKLDSLTCTGTLSEIETEVRQIGVERGIPQAVRDLIDVALKRLRKLDSR